MLLTLVAAGRASVDTCAFWLVERSRIKKPSPDSILCSSSAMCVRVVQSSSKVVCSVLLSMQTHSVLDCDDRCQVCRFVTGQPLVPFIPQSKFLGLISTGNKHAIATRGSLAFSGDWLWPMKDKIDRAFMNKFGSELPQMRTSASIAPINYLILVSNCAVAL